MRHGTGFGHAVTLTHAAPDALHALARKISAQRRGAGEDHFQARQVKIVDHWILSQLEHNRRHDMTERHAILLDQTQEQLEIETGHGHNRRAHVQPHIEHHAQTINMKERQDAKQPIVFSKIIKAVHLAHVRDQIVMGKHHSLGQARSAARIRQSDDIFFGIDVHLRDHAIALEQGTKWRGAAGFAEDKQLQDICGPSGRSRLFHKQWAGHEEPRARIL